MSDNPDLGQAERKYVDGELWMPVREHVARLAQAERDLQRLEVACAARGIPVIRAKHVLAALDPDEADA